jgi:Na+/proline symporter
VTIGTSILLIAVGAILRYAVNVHSSTVNIATVGLILMIAGILGLILSLLYTAFWADRMRPRRDTYADEQPTRRY